MVDLLFHIVFTFNAVVAAMAIVWYWSRRLFPQNAIHRRHFVWTCVALLGIRIAYVAVFVHVFGGHMSPDELRYYSEIQSIASSPWLWNPITGSGPYYQVTPKMGMSYLYGVILFFHQIDSLYGILVLNILVGLLAGITVFLLTDRLTPATVPAFIAMLLMAAYPETLFWTARVTRENLTLLLVPLLVYVSIRLYESYRLRYLIYACATIAFLLLVRAQLVLFAVLIVGYYGFVSLRGRRRIDTFAITAIAGVLLYMTFAALEAQIARAAGSQFRILLAFGREALVEQATGFVSNIGAVLTPIARGSYGAMGILMLPFALGFSGLLVLTLIRFRSIFKANLAAAGLLLVLSVCFLVALAIIGQVNIRFRSTVSPLLLSLIAVSVHYYWKALRLPRIVLGPRLSRNESIGNSVRRAVSVQGRRVEE